VKADVGIAGQMLGRAPHTELASTTPFQSATPLNRQQTGMPLESHIKADYSQSHERLYLADSYIRTPKTTLSLTGSISRTSSVAVHLQVNDLTELAAFSDLLPSAKAAQTMRSLRLAGEASFQGTVSGTIAAPQIAGHLAASHLQVDGSQWKTVRTDVQLSPSVIRLQNAHLELAPQGQIDLNANADLDHWSVSKTTHFAASADASNIDVAKLRRLTRQDVPVTGTLNGRLHAQGNIEALDGGGSIHLTRATAYRQPVQSAALSFSAAKGQIQTNLDIDIAGGIVKVSARIRPDKRTYVAQITSSGVRLDEIQRLGSRGVNATGVIAFDAEGRGTFDNPEMKARLRIPSAVVENHPISGVDLQVNMENKLINASLKSNVAHAPVEAQAKVSLAGEYPADISLNTEPVPLQTILALYRPDLAAQISGLTEVHLTLHGPLKNMKAIKGQATIPTLKLSYQNRVNLAATAPIHVDYQEGLLNLQPVQISGTDTDLRLQGTIPLKDHTPASLQVAGTINLQIAQLFNPELRSAGTAQINIHSSNAPNAGGFTGTVEIANASLASAAFPVGLQDGNGTLNVTGNRIDISSFRGTVGGGAVVAQGGVSLRPALAFDLGLTAADVNVLYPQGVRESFSANLRFTGSYERALLGGSVAISDVAFTPGFDFISVVSQVSGGVAAPTAPGFLQNITLNIAVHSTEMLSPASRTLSARGTAELEIRGTAAHPSLLGRVNLAGGSLIFHGNRYVLTGGTVQFVNPTQIRPVLNLSLSTTIQQYNIDLRFTGPAEQLRGEYTSNPSLPRADIISLLAFGTTTEASATGPSPANQAVESIAAQASGQITSRISKIAGISQLSVSPVLAGNTAQGPPGAVITIRQQVTGNLFVTFSANVASTQSQTIQGEYRLSPRVSISATRDPNGGFAVDALIKRSW
jgi:translocation and assembly module TamB